MDCIAHGVAKSQTGLSNFHFICLTLCNPMDCSPPGSSVHGIFQVRILEWVAISFSRDIPDPGIKPVFPAWQVDSLPLCYLGSPINTLY